MSPSKSDGSPSVAVSKVGAIVGRYVETITGTGTLYAIYAANTVDRA